MTPSFIHASLSPPIVPCELLKLAQVLLRDHFLQLIRADETHQLFQVFLCKQLFLKYHQGNSFLLRQADEILPTITTPLKLCPLCRSDIFAEEDIDTLLLEIRNDLIASLFEAL